MMVRRGVLALLFGFAIPLSAQRTILAVALTPATLSSPPVRHGRSRRAPYMTLGEGGNAKLTPSGI
jgi:hypothetical protein